MAQAPIDWSTLTQAAASRMIAGADRAEQAAAKRFNTSGSKEDEAAWRLAFDRWENLRVFAICGERPD